MFQNIIVLKFFKKGTPKIKRFMYDGGGCDVISFIFLPQKKYSRCKEKQKKIRGFAS